MSNAIDRERYFPEVVTKYLWPMKCVSSLKTWVNWCSLRDGMLSKLTFVLLARKIRWQWMCVLCDIS